MIYDMMYLNTESPGLEQIFELWFKIKIERKDLAEMNWNFIKVVIVVISSKWSKK